MPLLSTLLPDNVDYNEVIKTVTLTPGQNQIDDIAITLDQSGKVVHAEQIDRQIINRFSGFRDFRNFLTAGAHFFSLLAFCVFFVWYDKQPKTPYLLTLRKYTWRTFSFVSLWFTYWVIISKPVTLSYASYYLGIYLLTGISLAAVHYLYLYYCTTFSHKHRKIAGLISHIFEIRYRHYPLMARKALHKRQVRKDTYQRIGHYENQTFEALDKIIGQPTPVRGAKPTKRKLILIGLLLSVLAITPLLYQFVPKHVDYVKTTKTLLLVPGLNKIGSLSLTLSEHGKVLKAQKTDRQIIHKVFEFENLRIFLGNIAPFLTSLSLCLFFFWYEQQQKNPHVLALKRYVCTIFLLVSLWCVCWALIPEPNPIPRNFYYIGAFAVLCVGIASLQYLYRHDVGGLMRFCSKVRGLIYHLFEVRRDHYSPLALRALEKQDEYEKTCDEIERFDEQNTKALKKAKQDIPVDDKELEEDLDEAERKELLEKLLKRQQDSIKIKKYFEGLIKRYREGGDLGD